MLGRKDRQSYEGLQQEDVDEIHSAHEASQGRPEGIPWIWTCLLVVVCICTVVDTTLIARLLLQKSRPYNQSLEKTVQHKPQLRSSYMNLEALYKDDSVSRTKVGPIINHAPAMYQVLSTRPNEVQPVYSELILKHVGFAPMDVRRLVANASTSTIAQFRVMDFGMEICTLAVTVPPRNETEDIITGFEEALEGRGVVDIWILTEITTKVDPRKLSWANKPRVRKLLHSLPVRYGTSTETPKFSCPSLSYQTFEISCSVPKCNIDIIGRGSYSSGLHMWQYQSV
ncbi:hypothetical protein CPC08DRAFT_710368 [Agrocybe pediades]|nr:hypothetical protein CPC08DRAFT_710368 [Agrocybe pediades]